MPQNYNMLSSQLTTITDSLSVSELHGLLTAYVCLYNENANNCIDWTLIDTLGKNEESAHINILSDNSHFTNLCTQIVNDTLEALNTEGFAFELLLPDTGANYYQILELGAWCRGFSYAMIKTLSDISPEPSSAPNYANLGLSEVGIEAIEDIIEISQINEDTDDDDADIALAEIQEYLRVATQTIFEDIAIYVAQQKPDDESQYH